MFEELGKYKGFGIFAEADDTWCGKVTATNLSDYPGLELCCDSDFSPCTNNYESKALEKAKNRIDNFLNTKLLVFGDRCDEIYLRKEGDKKYYKEIILSYKKPRDTKLSNIMNKLYTELENNNLIGMISTINTTSHGMDEGSIYDYIVYLSSKFVIIDEKAYTGGFYKDNVFKPLKGITWPDIKDFCEKSYKEYSYDPNELYFYYIDSKGEIKSIVGPQYTDNFYKRFKLV